MSNATPPKEGCKAKLKHIHRRLLIDDPSAVAFRVISSLDPKKDRALLEETATRSKDTIIRVEAIRKLGKKSKSVLESLFHQRFTTGYIRAEIKKRLDAIKSK